MKSVKSIAVALIGALTTLFLTSPALADEAAESYVEANVNQVLTALNQPELTGDERREQFNGYMNKFANMKKISRFVVAHHGRAFKSGDVDFEPYFAAFQTYALATYEVQLDKYRGEQIEVLGSIDRPRDTIVKTRIRSDTLDRDLRVDWMVRKNNKDDGYQVIDVALLLEGNMFWLAQEQRSQFVSILERASGTPQERFNVLISRIEDMTRDLRNEKTAELATATPETQLASTDS